MSYMEIADAPWIREAERFGGDDWPEPQCPICYDEPETAYYTADGDELGCDCCIDYEFVDGETCPECGKECEKKYFFRKSKDVIGCDNCIEERDIDFMHSNPAFFPAGYSRY